MCVYTGVMVSVWTWEDTLELSLIYFYVSSRDGTQGVVWLHVSDLIGPYLGLKFIYMC